MMADTTNISNAEIILKFEKAKPKIYEMAQKVTDKQKTLVKISKNMMLFGKISKSKSQLFDNLTEALLKLRDSAAGVMLIQFTELDLWGIYTQIDYLALLTNIQFDVDCDYNFNFYQIVLAGCKQKLVFACTNRDYYEKLQAYARDCFKTDVNECDNHITVNIETNNENEIIDCYNKLFKYIYNRGDEQCCESMKQIQAIPNAICDYRKYSCSTGEIGEINEERLLKAIKTFPVVINNTYNITVNGGNNNIGNGVINIMKFNIDKKQLAKDWVIDNPPEEIESTVEYYERYRADNPKGLANTLFGPIVRAEGYEYVHGTGSMRRWRKK